MLTIHGLQLSYDLHQVLCDLNLELAPRTLGVLKGPNGCGKTSLLNCIAGVIPEYLPATIDGSIYLGEHNLRYIPLKEKFHYLWYSCSGLPGQFFFPTCEAEIGFALENLGMDPLKIRTRVTAAATRFGLYEELFQSPNTLSAGQQNLLLCAMAEALDPPLVLLDEPSRGLAGNSLELLCDWINDLKTRDRIILCAEHHPRIIGMADELFELQGKGSHDQN